MTRDVNARFVNGSKMADTEGVSFDSNEQAKEFILEHERQTAQKYVVNYKKEYQGSAVNYKQFLN